MTGHSGTTSETSVSQVRAPTSIICQWAWECGGSTPLSFVFRFFKATHQKQETKNKESGVEPPHSKVTKQPMNATLFVYGTLRPRCRHPMADFLARRGVYRGEARVAGQLFDLGRYPAAVPRAQPNQWVHGDLFDLDEITLAELDRYEAVESPGVSYFGRRLETVSLDSGETVQAWVYWFHGPLPPEATQIVSGQYARIFDAV
jgi:gamma-glutamylcyclotransferase (GGCT)/AIG2-like uncharacterized protein YtfP